MKILIITPALPSARAGNRTTAQRWGMIFESLGHKVRIATRYDGSTVDTIVVLHAWRNAQAVHDFTTRFPDRPCILALTGTDIYQFIDSAPDITLSSIRAATHLVGLNDQAKYRLPVDQREKLTIIFQSCQFHNVRPRPQKHFEICVAGHLREEKDPLRPALAVRALPSSSKIKVAHYGKAFNLRWQQQARLETARNRRYQWCGEILPAQLINSYARASLLIQPSYMEGGANTVSEALTAHLPVVASRIAGNVGLLGEDYPGLFEPGNTEELRQLLLRAEKDKRFYRELDESCRSKRHAFSRACETSAWQKLLKQI